MSNRSDGSTADYYELPEGATELQHLISHRNMNAQLGEIFRAAYRYGMASHSDMLRDAKKIKFYISAEIDRLEKLESAKVVWPTPEQEARINNIVLSHGDGEHYAEVCKKSGHIWEELGEGLPGRACLRCMTTEA